MADRKTKYKFYGVIQGPNHLWNYLYRNYKNRDLRWASLEQIRMELGLQDTNEVAKNIKSWCSTYNQKLLKLLKSKKTRCGTDEIYKPSIKWFDGMPSNCSVAFEVIFKFISHFLCFCFQSLIDLRVMVALFFINIWPLLLQIDSKVHDVFILCRSWWSIGFWWSDTLCKVHSHRTIFTAVSSSNWIGLYLHI